MIGLEQMTPAGQENTEPVVMPDDEVLYELADLFRVFGDSTRIKILYALHDNELCVQDIANAVLTMIGYSAATAFDPEVTMGIFNISCIAPAIGFVAVALSLFFIYPLTKQKVEENVAALAQRHNK